MKVETPNSHKMTSCKNHTFNELLGEAREQNWICNQIKDTDLTAWCVHEAKLVKSAKLYDHSMTQHSWIWYSGTIHVYKSFVWQWHHCHNSILVGHHTVQRQNILSWKLQYRKHSNISETEIQIQFMKLIITGKQIKESVVLSWQSPGYTQFSDLSHSVLFQFRWHLEAKKFSSDYKGQKSHLQLNIKANIEVLKQKLKQRTRNKETI